MGGGTGGGLKAVRHAVALCAQSVVRVPLRNLDSKVADAEDVGVRPPALSRAIEARLMEGYGKRCSDILSSAQPATTGHCRP